MYLISAERYINVEVDFLRVRKTDEIWVSMENVQDGVAVKNMSDLILKETYGKYERENLSDHESKKYKMTERENVKKYHNLSENELNNKKQKIQKWCYNHCYFTLQSWKKSAEKKNRPIQKKIRVYRTWYYGTQWILNQIKNTENVCKRKSTWRI